MKNKRTGYLLALFLGVFGAHLFYYKKYVRAILYLLFFWTYVPILLGWIDMLFIKKWNEEINNNILCEIEKTVNAYEDDGAEKSTLKKETEHSKSSDKTTKRQNVESFLKESFEFYNDKDIILEEYNHLTTPNDIVESVNEVKSDTENTYNRNSPTIQFTVSNSQKEFVKNSLKFAKKRGKQTKEIPFSSYWPTFSSLNDRQLKWYFYWREQVLNNNYIDVDLSYIFIFVYELLNYSFNSKAAFNISMLVRLMENYEDRFPEINKYLTEWIADMLYELGETDLAAQWDTTEDRIPPLYNEIQHNKDSLNSISITYWKPYLKNYRETEFFKQNKNKIYNKFKQGIVTVQKRLNDNSENVLNVWFEQRDRRIVRELYQSAVMGRRFDPVHVYVKEYRPTDKLTEMVSNLFRLSENIVRSESGVKREIKVDDSVLPENLRNDLLDSKDRFKMVQSKEQSSKGSSIPKKPANEEPESNIINLNWEEIKRKEKELDILQNAIETSTANDIEPIVDKTDNNAVTSLDETNNDSFFSKEKSAHDSITAMGIFNDVDEDYEGFLDSLNSIEKEFVLMFESSIVSFEKAAAFAKNNGMMLTVLLTAINEKANENLEDILFEEDSDEVRIIKDFQDVIDYVRGDLIEN